MRRLPPEVSQAEMYRGAAKILQEQGEVWGARDLCDPYTGQMCIHGLMAKAVWPQWSVTYIANKNLSVAARVIREQYPEWIKKEMLPDNYPDDSLIIRWNDNVCDSGAECLMVLEKAAAMAEEEGV